MEHDGPIRVPENEPGGIDTNDIVIVSADTDDPALNMIMDQNGNVENLNQKKYLNINGDIDVDEFEDNVTDPMVDKITENGMVINMNEEEDDEIVDEIDNDDYITAGGEDINMNETDDDSK